LTPSRSQGVATGPSDAAQSVYLGFHPMARLTDPASTSRSRRACDHPVITPTRRQAGIVPGQKTGPTFQCLERETTE
jgi:hypothetical protein